MSALDIAVVVPLEDPRGDVVEHLRSWTDRQTLARERYQLVAAADDAHPEFVRRVREILQPQDEIVSAPGASLMSLYDAAARAASANVLVFTEAHCHAESDCLAAVSELFARDPDVDGAQFHHRQEIHGDFGRLSERWFERSYAHWRQYDWTRLKIGGSAIRAETYERAGGIDPEMDLFAPFFLSARIHELGGRVEHLESAVITHVLEEAMGEDLQHTGRYARGECIARAKHDPQFMDRYFGPGGLWDRRLVYRPDESRALTAALVSAARSSPRHRRWLARELVVRLPARMARSRPRRAWESAMAGVQQMLTDSSLVPFETRWRSYVSASEHTIRAVQLIEADSTKEEIGPHAGPGLLDPHQLEGVLVPAHGVERHDGRAFRWTEPVAMLRLRTDGPVTLRIETGGIRGEPLGYLQGAYVGRRRVPDDSITQDGDALEIRLDDRFTGGGETVLVLICRPLIPSRDASSDRRRLGMPVLELSLSDRADADRSAARSKALGSPA